MGDWSAVLMISHLENLGPSRSCMMFFGEHGSLTCLESQASYGDNEVVLNVPANCMPYKKHIRMLMFEQKPSEIR